MATENMSLASVPEALADQVLSGGDRRSDAYRLGLVGVFRNKFEGTVIECPSRWAEGSADYDAFYYGAQRAQQEWAAVLQESELRQSQNELLSVQANSAPAPLEHFALESLLAVQASTDTVTLTRERFESLVLDGKQREVEVYERIRQMAAYSEAPAFFHDWLDLMQSQARSAMTSKFINKETAVTNNAPADTSD
ncbi:hypothetical protein ACYCFK_09550 [Stutzerimonas stutzeri]